MRYTNIAEMKSSARLWIARLEFERSRPESAAEPDVRRTWKQARDSVRGEGALKVWTWGVPSEDIIQSEQQAQAALKLVELPLTDNPSYVGITVSFYYTLTNDYPLSSQRPPPTTLRGAPNTQTRPRTFTVYHRSR